MTSVLQDWVMELPLREQGTLLTAVRGCDDEPKQWTATGFSDSPGRRLTAFIRWCFMNPADVREVDIPGAFFQSSPPEKFKPSEFGHLPLHWNTHVMHALEVIGYRHPTAWVRTTAHELYRAMVHGLHLNMEGRDQMIMLTDSEARWEAIVLIDATVRNAIAGGCLHQPQKWTDDDAIAIEKHAIDRVNGLLRRPRKGATDGG